MVEVVTVAVMAMVEGTESELLAVSTLLSVSAGSEVDSTDDTERLKVLSKVAMNGVLLRSGEAGNEVGYCINIQ